jgi:hypothetical protein
MKKQTTYTDSGELPAELKTSEEISMEKNKDE